MVGITPPYPTSPYDIYYNVSPQFFYLFHINTEKASFNKHKIYNKKSVPNISKISGSIMYGMVRTVNMYDKLGKIYRIPIFYPNTY